MSNSGQFGGTVINQSSSDLLVAYNDPADPKLWRYSLLKAGSTTDAKLDVDGFKAADGKGITWKRKLLADEGPTTNWWKIRDMTKADVKDNAPGLSFQVVGVLSSGASQKTDKDFEYEDGVSKISPFP